jgi:hypothetical protein
MSRELRALGYRKLSARPRHHEQAEGAIEDFKQHSPRDRKKSPTENFRQFLRDNWLSNRSFKSFEDILDRRCDASNELIDQPWPIMSIGTRDWALQILISEPR